MANEGRFRQGDLVEVRSAAEILATLDERGELDGMPFMPEMTQYCGQRLRVYRRADKLCDTINLDMTSRNPGNTVFLEMARCDGSGHGGCQAECRICWKEAWLRPVPGRASAHGAGDGASHLHVSTRVDRPADADALIQRVSANATNGAAGDEVRYRCQATQLVDASTRLSVTDPRPYLRELTSGNVRFGRWVKVMGRAVVMQTANKLGRLKMPVLKGLSQTTPKFPPLDLQPGEWVRVKSPSEIEATLNDQGRNRGLWFDREFLPYCGHVFQVRKRATNIIDEPSGKMVSFTNDCIVLEGTVCSGDLSPGRWFCPREIICYWRECWLERVDAPPESPASATESAGTNS